MASGGDAQGPSGRLGTGDGPLRCTACPDVDPAIYRFADMSAGFDAPDEEGVLVWGSTQPRGLVGHVVRLPGPRSMTRALAVRGGWSDLSP